MGLVNKRLAVSVGAGLLLLCVALILAACSEGGGAQQPPASAPTAASTKAPQSQPTAAAAPTKAPQSQPTAAAPQAKTGQSGSGGAVDVCALLTQAEIAEIVGNPVKNGEHYAVDTCRWDTEQVEQVSALLIVHAPGSIREQVLCEDLRKGGGGGEALKGLGDVAVWEFSSTMVIFNSGDLETCGPKGFLSLSLNGKRDEAALKQAALSMVNKVLGRL